MFLFVVMSCLFVVMFIHKMFIHKTQFVWVLQVLLHNPQPALLQLVWFGIQKELLCSESCCVVSRSRSRTWGGITRP